MKSALLSEYVGAQVRAGHGASGECFNGRTSLGGNLVAHPPVADHGLPHAKGAGKSGYPIEVLNRFGECFHVAKYHASCWLMSTLYVLDADHAS